jgi:DNA-directed RNA polymerase subunit RPC12/RpoP
MFIPDHVRDQVIQRAKNRCEYCGISQEGQEAAFHVDHAVPLNAGGQTILENLALACVSCSLRRGARQRATDPKTGKLAPLFNPRRDAWRLHFRWNDVRVIGLSPVGRATVAVLQMNRPVAQAIRHYEIARGTHPPPRHL